MHNISIPSPIVLQLHPACDGVKCFYQYKVNTETIINGNGHKTRHSKLLHLTIKPHQASGYEFLMESFDSIIKDSNLSLGIKDLLDRLGRIIQDVTLHLSDNGSLISILNYNEMIAQIEDIRDFIYQRYRGVGLSKINDYFVNVILVKNNLIKYLYDYRRLGLLLQIPYGWIGASFSQNKKLKHNNLLDNAILEIESQFKLEKNNGQEIVIVGQGKLTNFSYYLPLINNAIQSLGIPLMLNDKPELFNYNHHIILNSMTHIPKSVSLDIDFSFGKNYKRVIHYQLSQYSFDGI